MKKMIRMFALLLAMALLLCACGSTEESAAETEPAKPAAATTAEELAEMLTTGRGVLGADLQLTKEILVDGTILDGGNHTITGPEVLKEEIDGETKTVVETENGITVAGGTVENIVINGNYRTIGDRKGAGANADVRLKNVTVNGGESYAINFGYGNGQASLYAENCTLNGWSSYTKFQKAIFTNCTFGFNESGSEGALRPYIDTTLVGCKFEGWTQADGTVIPFGINFKNGSDGIHLTLEDCYVGDTLVTQENLNELLKVNLQGNVIEVRNTHA